jgi:hypothetical protein
LEGRRAVDTCFFGLASPVRIKKDGSEVGRPDDHNEQGKDMDRVGRNEDRVFEGIGT